MKIIAIHAKIKDLALTKPYAIAGHHFNSVRNVFLRIILDNGIIGLGAASPAEEVVGETCESTLVALNTDIVQTWVGRDIRDFKTIMNEANGYFPRSPGVLAALDIALHDAWSQYLDVPMVALYGQKIESLPCSMTIGIMSLPDTLEHAASYLKMGYNVLKLKLGDHLDEDIERVICLHKTYGSLLHLRVDANMGYSLEQFKQFLKATREVPLELIEQPLPCGAEDALRILDAPIRRKLVADESLVFPNDALDLIQTPQPYGVFNIKLMKCGGIINALQIAKMAENANIDLFWGCNDESVISITAALHTAYCCDNTRYLDLDGSLDLAEDLVSGGFFFKNGNMHIMPKSGLGLSWKDLNF
jgi:L-alanine-DL-glutamate epimerase-like enolase superfamily enzyme